MCATAAKAGENRYESTGKGKHSRNAMHARENAFRQRVILVEVTGSRIPQRVVLMGTQVNSGSPLFVIQGNDLVRSGATSVAGILSIDPNISFGGPRFR